MTLTPGTVVAILPFGRLGTVVAARVDGALVERADGPLWLDRVALCPALPRMLAHRPALLERHRREAQAAYERRNSLFDGVSP